jgi:hypothetical protein
MLFQDGKSWDLVKNHISTWRVDCFGFEVTQGCRTANTIPCGTRFCLKNYESKKIAL